MTIRAMTIAQMNKATPRLNGDAEMTDIISGLRYTVRIVNPGTYHHSDFEPKTRADAVVMLQIAGGRWSWNPRPTIMRWNNNVTACAIHTMPHAGHLYGRFSFNVMTDLALRLNANGSHFCCHYINSKEVRFRSRQNSLNWWLQMNSAVLEAERLANLRTSHSTTAQKTAQVATSQTRTHIVRSGDTLTRIANSNAISLPSLLAANPEITNPDHIQIGQIINIPR